MEINFGFARKFKTNLFLLFIITTALHYTNEANIIENISIYIYYSLRKYKYIDSLQELEITCMHIMHTLGVASFK